MRTRIQEGALSALKSPSRPPARARLVEIGEALGRAAAIDTDSPLHRLERAEHARRVWRAIRRTRPGR